MNQALLTYLAQFHRGLRADGRLRGSLAPLWLFVLLIGCRSEPPAPRLPSIAGLKQIDIIAALSDQGFIQEGAASGPEFECRCVKSENGVDYKVRSYGSYKTTRWVECSIDTTQAEPGAPYDALQVLTTVAALKYEGAEPAAARQWVEKHWQERSAKTVIGQVQFELANPSETVRVLKMTPIQASGASAGT